MADLDIARIVAQADLPAIARAWGEVKTKGNEYVIRCPFHSPDNNPSCYLFNKGEKWQFKCFSCGQAGDALDWVKELEGLDVPQAAKRLQGRLWEPLAQEPKPTPPTPVRITSKPPADAPRPYFYTPHLGGDPSSVWEYRDADGSILGYVSRHDPEGGEKKIRPWTWGSVAGEPAQWDMKTWSGERPLYGLDRLAARPKAPVLIVEGEKACDAAQKLLPDYVAVTWQGGAQAWKKANLTPLHGRKILLWPDNDATGIEAMQKLEASLAQFCEGKTIDPEGMAECFDAADWTGTREELIAWAKPRAKLWGGALTTSGEQTSSVQIDPPPPEFPPEADVARPIRGPLGFNSYESISEVEFRSMSQIESRPIDWLWPGRIAKGKVSMIVGNPGLGKSQVCASLASVISNGGSWPVDRAPCERGSVVFLSAEDDPEDTIRPRLDAAGANVEKIFILDAIRVQDETGEDHQRRGFDLTKDVRRLGALLQELGDVALVIIDPVTAYLGQADSHKNAEVRALLAPLAELAANQRVAILAVSHLTKSSGMDALLRVQGSIGFAAAARAVWGVAKDKDNPSRRLFMPLKNNLGTDVNGFAYSVESTTLQDSDISTSHVMWENELVTLSADEVFGQSEHNAEERQSLNDAKDFLRSALGYGPVATKDLQKDADGAGYSWATVRRAQQELKVEAFKDGVRGPWKWRLPQSQQTSQD